MEPKLHIQKPFLKWVGGKTQIITKIVNKMSGMKMKNYHEPFLGGGSVLLAVLSLHRHEIIDISGNIYAYDINKSLINVYKNIQSNKEELHEYLSHYISEYDSIVGNEVNRSPKNLEQAMTSKESYYYWIRNKYNTSSKDSVESSSIFMFLNKTCFRGMYREGPNGFNIPYGHYKKTPSILSMEELIYISELIQDVVFQALDFNDSIKSIKEGDFVYFDPPYVKLSYTSFVGYTSVGFDDTMHGKLFNYVKQLKDSDISFVMSNSDTDMVKESFNDFNIEYVKARRAINAKNPGSSTTEVIIHNLI